MAGYAETKITPTGLLRTVALGTLDCAMVLGGLGEFMVRGKNSDAAFHSMLRLHCQTNGRSTRLLTSLLRRSGSARTLSLPSQAQSLFAAVTAEQEGSIADEIHREGFAVLPVRLPEAACDELTRFSKETAAQAIGVSAEVISEKRFDTSDPRVVRFKYDPNDLVTSPVVQKLLCDPVLMRIAQRYFGTPPLVDSVTMWWSLAKGAAPSSDLAQLYHFDFDRPKWLKLFFYISDVDAGAGPHTYVRRSHRADRRRAHLLRRGYVRIPDEEIEATYSKESVVEIAGRKGTVFFEDTSGFHKGKAPTSGDRLLFEIQFSLSRFGARYPSVTLPEKRDPAFASFYREHPWLYPIFEAA